ncbi:phosphoribosylaminoimidazolesuccinocarboxamide synthase [bacterium]|nr:phosphoribosylaminoimidazolesuccinocarboxamide synthase [bacterium]
MSERRTLIQSQMEYLLESTDLEFLSEKYEGKVRDSYRGKRCRYLVTTDRLSSFDVVLGAVPFKGQVLNTLAAHWFAETDHLVQNHLIDCPDPNVMAVRDLDIIPIEVVVRAYIAGSAWRDYEKGNPVSGVSLPAGLREFEKLPECIVTPSTKAEVGTHDEPISEAEILQRGLVSPELWDKVRENALQLFRFASEQVAPRGLLLVDTKYEFGLLSGEVVLADEIHTLDSSRYWEAESYDARLSRGEPPEMLDKEPVRRHLLSQGYFGDGPPPRLSPEFLVDLSEHYLHAFERISGKSISLISGDAGARIANNVREFEEAYSGVGSN